MILLRALILLVCLTAGGLGHLSKAGPLEEIVCIPPVVQSEARCTFNIYGYVTDKDRIPLAGVWVSDGDFNAVTNDQGFYDLWELQNGGDFGLTFWLPGREGCHRTYRVNTQVQKALLEGGTRQDAQLPCSLQGGE